MEKKHRYLIFVLLIFLLIGLLFFFETGAISLGAWGRNRAIRWK